MYVIVKVEVKTDDSDPKEGDPGFAQLITDIAKGMREAFDEAYAKDRNMGVAGFPAGASRVLYFGVHKRRQRS